MSNHPDAQKMAASYGIAYREFPIASDNKAAQKKEQSEILRQEAIDGLALARYGQILTPEFVAEF